MERSIFMTTSFIKDGVIKNLYCIFRYLHLGPCLSLYGPENRYRRTTINYLYKTGIYEYEEMQQRTLLDI